MKRIFNSRRDGFLAKVCIFLIMSALIAGMMGYGGSCDGYTPPSENLKIRTWYDLDAISNNLSGSYILMNDIDDTTAGYAELASPTANGGKGWQPIGTHDDPFTGAFDGQGYEIRNLFIDRPDEDDIGLFGSVEQSGVIENIGVTNATVIGQDRVGGLVGANRDEGTVSNSYYSGSVTGSNGYYHFGGLVGGNEGTVTNSYSTGIVTGGANVGGLVGINVGTVSNSHSSSNVTCSIYDYCIGGLVGANLDEGTVSNSYSTGSVTGDSGVGGLVGANGVSGPATVTNSYSTGSVTGQSYVGGLVGGNGGWDYPPSTVTDSYATGSVTGNLSVGGLVGGNVYGTVTDSYSVGNVTGVDNVGGLVGENDGEVSNSYSTGSVTGESYVGGLVGISEEVSESYATGSVTGNSSVGGLVGRNCDVVRKCYSIGVVTGSSSVGGLVGASANGTSVSDSFWDTETSGQATSDGGTGKNTTEMQEIATFSGATWDIVAVADPSIRNPSYFWNIVDDETYPFLSWQP